MTVVKCLYSAAGLQTAHECSECILHTAGVERVKEIVTVVWCVLELQTAWNAVCVSR